MKQSHKLVTMLVSLLAAILLWLYVVTLVAPEMTTTVSAISINLDGTTVLEERGLIITSQTPDVLSLVINTSRVNLSKLNAKSIRINADASKIRGPGEYDLTCTVLLPDTVRTSDVEILRKNVDAVHITVSKLETRSIPIKLDWKGAVKEGYVFEAESALPEPAEIVVTGPDFEVDQIDRAVVSYDVSALEQTELVTLPISFLNADGEVLSFSDKTSVSASSVNLTLTVLRTKELTLEVQLEEGGGVSQQNAVVTVDPPTIWVKGAADVIEELDDTFLLGTVDLSKISDHEERTFALALPAGVTNISGETEAQVVIDIKGVSSSTIPISDIRLVNAPEGYQAEVSTRTVKINVRGSTEEIRELQQNKNNGIYILVDLGDYTQTGAFTVPGTIVNSTHPAIGVGNTVEIGVVISAKEPDETPED